MLRKVYLILPLACLLLIGCSQAKPATGPAKPPEVIVGYPISQTVTDFEEFPGRIEAVNTVDVKARAQGYLTEIYFVDGQEVKAGDLLAAIQQDTYEASVRAAKASVALNEAYLKIANITLSRAQNSVIATSPLEIDQDKAQLEQAEANLNLARANLTTAETNLAYTKVRAPISGRISSRRVDPGNTIIADNTSLTTIVSLDPVYVYFDIDERTMLRLERLSQETNIPVPWKPILPRRAAGSVVAGIGKSALESPGLPKTKIGLSVAIALSDEQNFKHQGVMNFADNVVNRQTGTLRVRGEFDNPDRLLKSGMFCRVQVPIGIPHQATLVADSALNTDQGRKYLFVLDDANKASERDVDIGALHGELREILKDKKGNAAVKSNERVVIEGLQRVKSGGVVTPKEKDMREERGTREPALAPNQAGGKSSEK